MGRWWLGGVWAGRVSRWGLGGGRSSLARGGGLWLGGGGSRWGRE